MAPLLPRLPHPAIYLWLPRLPHPALYLWFSSLPRVPHPAISRGTLPWVPHPAISLRYSTVGASSGDLPPVLCRECLIRRSLTALCRECLIRRSLTATLPLDATRYRCLKQDYKQFIDSILILILILISHSHFSFSFSFSFLILMTLDS